MLFTFLPNFMNQSLVSFKVSLLPSVSTLGPNFVVSKIFLSSASDIVNHIQSAEDNDFWLDSQKKVLLNWGQALTESESSSFSTFSSQSNSRSEAFLEVNARQNFVAGEVLYSSLKLSLFPTSVDWQCWLSQRNASTSCFE